MVMLKIKSKFRSLCVSVSERERVCCCCSSSDRFGLTESWTVHAHSPPASSEVSPTSLNSTNAPIKYAVVCSLNPLAKRKWMQRLQGPPTTMLSFPFQYFTIFTSAFCFLLFLCSKERVFGGTWQKSKVFMVHSTIPTSSSVFNTMQGRHTQAGSPSCGCSLPNTKFSSVPHPHPSLVPGAVAPPAPL